MKTRTLIWGSLIALALAVLPIQDVQSGEPPELPNCETLDPQESIIHLACNIFFEARNQSIGGKVSVAIITMNRVSHPNFPDTVYDVIWQDRQFSWTQDGKSDQIPAAESEREAWNRALWVAELVWTAAHDPDFDIQVGKISLDNSHFYHANFVSPRWSRKMIQVGTVGDHIFYCDPQIADCDS